MCKDSMVKRRHWDKLDKEESQVFLVISLCWKFITMIPVLFFCLELSMALWNRYFRSIQSQCNIQPSEQREHRDELNPEMLV